MSDSPLARTAETIRQASPTEPANGDVRSPPTTPAGRGGPPPAVPGYEIEGELGRGGMGVVYKARQLSLNRTVAVKILLGGGHAGQHEQARFRAEATTLAALQHPNIVQVYEVGEAAGAPFLALEYCPGGTLADRLGGAPVPPRDAARLAEALAGGVAAAHAAGVVHRDLKPANVLLAADGTPKVTDFGLAKQGDSGLTVTGAVIGTPSYMAPEQAAGGSKGVGPAADVWALGAILYECLTGRPPFRGVSTHATLDLVRTAEPVPPRRLQPAVPADLAAVCLMCLEKEPARRYPSAAALAADLGRFLAGRATAARPVGPVARAVKWCRRNRPAAALAAVAAAVPVAAGVGVAVHTARLRAALDEKTREEARTRAEKERADGNYRLAREAMGRMLARLGEPQYGGVPRLTELRRAQARDALAFFQTVAARQDDPSPEVRYDAARADTEAGRLHYALGERGPAADHFRAARAGLARLAAEDPGDLRYRTALVDATLHLLAAGPGPGADPAALIAEAVAGARAAAADPAAGDPERSLLANALVASGNALNLAGRPAEGIPPLEEALGLRRALVARRPGDRAAARDLAETMLNLSAAYRGAGRAGPAAELHDECEARLEELAAADPDDRATACSLAVERVNWAYVLAADGRAAEAADRLGRSVAPLDRLYRLEPNDARVRDALYRVHGMRGELYAGLCRPADAVRDRAAAVRYAAPDRTRFTRWFAARSRADAGDVAGCLADLEAQLREDPAGATDGEW